MSNLLDQSSTLERWYLAASRALYDSLYLASKDTRPASSAFLLTTIVESLQLLFFPLALLRGGNVLRVLENILQVSVHRS